MSKNYINVWKRINRQVLSSIAQNVDVVENNDDHTNFEDPHIEVIKSDTVLSDTDNFEGDVFSFSSDDTIESYSDIDDIEETVEEFDLCKELASCAVKNQWSHSSVNELLIILQKSGLNVPKDVRTLIKTPRIVSTYKKCGGEYVYFGLLDGILKVFNGTPETKNTKTIRLSVNTDGIPLFKSSSTQLWPILCSFDGHDIFTVAIFCGTGKPDSLDDYLDDFIKEYRELSKNGIIIDDQKRAVEILSFICDTPARCFLKRIIGHCGYSSCERCLIIGSYNGRVVFNENDLFPARTETVFRDNGYDSHQQGITPLLTIGIPCIKSFLLDYMHLVCLGVVRRILNYMKKGPSGKLSHFQRTEMTNNLIKLNGCLPSEFSRQPRSLNELDRWKATEFRQFLLYLGPVVLRNIISENAYIHFLSLSIAISILLNSDEEKRNMHLNYARGLLVYFVQNSKIFYGNTFTVYNVHNLLHICDDVENFNCSLNDISCFPFENHLQRLKRFVRQSKNPINQVAKRETEYGLCFTKLTHKTLYTKVSANKKDRCFYLKDGSIAFVLQKLTNDSYKCDVFSQCYLDNVFVNPVESKTFNIFLLRTVNAQKGRSKQLNKSEFIRKCVCLPEERGYSLFPLLHSIERS